MTRAVSKLARTDAAPPRVGLATPTVLTLVAMAASALALAACERDPAARPADPAPAAASATGAPVMPADAPPQEELPAEAEAPADCAAQIGQTAAEALAQRCRAVSPATRPPCHTANPCALIQDEITRACAQFDAADRPAACAA